MKLITLDGCKPTPLAHYLKALGILRIVATQADERVRGAWRGGRFALLTSLDREELVEFILHRYAPTPILSPWNGGSGFYPKDNAQAMNAIASSPAERFKPYRKAIERSRDLVGGRAIRPAGDEKIEMLTECLAEWAEPELEWFASAVMLDDAGQPAYPALLGTGGNDGRLDFSNNYMQRLVQLFDPETGAPSAEAEAQLPNALFAEPMPGLAGGAVGQFNPGAAGGPNSGPGFAGAPKWNPWDFILMLEGAMVLRVAGIRKLESNQRIQLAAPFALRSSARGFGTAADEEDAARGEQWLPLWSKPASFAEVSQLFAEARLRSPQKRAEGALDAAKALGTLGVARGLEAFVRYGYLVRNGLSNLAVPLGVFAVRHHPEVRLLDEVDDYLSRWRRAAAPTAAASTASVRSISRALDTAALSCAESPTDSARWQTLVMALGDSEHALNTRPSLVADAFLRGLPRLSFGWFHAIDDGSTEVRLALAIATASDRRLGPIRRHAIPLEAKTRYRDVARSADGLARDSAVVWGHRDLPSDLAAVATRRALESEGGIFPLMSPFPARLGDIAAFLEGRVNDERILRLARGLMTLTDDVDDETARAVNRRPGEHTPLAAHAMVRLCYPCAYGDFPQQHASNLPLRLLSSGQITDASAALQRYLSSRGIRSKLRSLSGSERYARRLAASVAIPVSARDHARLFQLISRNEIASIEESQPS